MKKLIIPLAILAMGLLLGAAVVADCLRLAADARERVALADAEIEKHERRLVKLLDGWAEKSPVVAAAIATFEAADGPTARNEAYERLVASFHQSEPKDLDPTNPLDRKFMDDTAGAINRHEVAQKPYDEESAAYRQFLASWKGAVARRFSSQARADWNAE
jgi:hypothetical protein